jgi:hypothetical protein
MIQLNSDSLLFEMPGGEAIPCSAETVTIQLIGAANSLLDPELVRNAARAVLYYFKVEQGRSFVSVCEFSEALAVVLRGFGLDVKDSSATESARRIIESDLRRLACESGKGYELAFFPLLHDELLHQLDQSPQVLRFHGLRSCVKQLVGARRWTDRCQRLNDQIVEYLRHCLNAEARAKECALMVV